MRHHSAPDVDAGGAPGICWGLGNEMQGLDARDGSRGVRVRCQTLNELFARFLKEEAGQDLVEYALLTATVGLASAAVWTMLGPTIRSAYLSWNNNLYNLWQSPDPS